jgi:hypothetical protein
MQDIYDKDYFVIASVGVRNEGSTTSLLMEFQIRENGIVIDSTSRKHTGIDGNPGTQCIVFHDEGVTIILYTQLALMTYIVREPTDEEIDTLPRLILTFPDLWDPKSHQDNDEIVFPLNSNMANALKTKSASLIPFMNPGGSRAQQSVSKQPFLIPGG